MKHKIKHIIVEIVGVILIVIGVVSYPFPVPGSTVIIVSGLTLVLGKHGAKRFMKHIWPRIKRKK